MNKNINTTTEFSWDKPKKNNKVIIALFFIDIMLLGVGYLFITGDKNNEIGDLQHKTSQFIPKEDIISERTDEDGNRIFIFDGGIEVNENMYVDDTKGNKYDAYSDDIPNDDGTRTIVIS